MEQIADHFQEALLVLQKFNTPENHKKIEDAAKIMVQSLVNDGKILSCGNGGSLCDAFYDIFDR